MTLGNIHEALYQTLTAQCPTVTWSQRLLERPTNTTIWGAITFDGAPKRSLVDYNRQYVYFKLWIYMDTEDETLLVNKAEEAANVVHDKLISGKGTGKVRFICTGISPVFFAEEYQQRGITVSLRTLTTSI